MIVTDFNQGLMLVRQTDHAAMSAQLASAWGVPSSLFPPAVWSRFVEAVRRHDNGWKLADDQPVLSESGRPHDFKSMPTALHLEIWRRSVDLADDGDPLIALLVAQHARWLYTTLPSDDANPGEMMAIQEFLDELTLAVARDLGRLMDEPTSSARMAVQPRSLQVARRLFTFFDQLSLMMLGAIPISGRTETLDFHHRQSALLLTPAPQQERTLLAEPWPFEPETVTVTCPITVLEQAQFTNRDELRQAITAAPQQSMAWTIKPA